MNLPVNAILHFAVAFLGIVIFVSFWKILLVHFSLLLYETALHIIGGIFLNRL